MIIDKSQALVVLLGAFNTQVLRDPFWVNKYIFSDSNSDPLNSTMRLDMLTDKITTFFENDGLKIEVSLGRIAITPKDLSKDSIDSTYDIITKISQSLPRAIINAYGVNFGFLGEVTRPFLWKETKILMKTSENISMLDFKQVLECEDYRINYSISEEKTASKKYKERLTFNFHTNLNRKTAEEAFADFPKSKRIETFWNLAKQQAKSVLGDDKLE